MKNKHLVLLFLGVLALGAASRWLPVRYRSFFETHLLRVEPNDVSRMVVSAPGKPDLLLERIEGGWSAEQAGRTVIAPTETVAEMLGLLTGITSFQMIKTTYPDTLGLTPENQLRIRLFQQNKLLENIEIGGEGVFGGEPGTFLRLPRHAGIYRAPGHLRKPFLRTLDDFRSKIAVRIEPDAVQKISLTRPDTSLFFGKK
ncbi:MAG: DUF4340 domain-containing protein [Lewinellaceae bacterium]|nr:DUF4340 domain-containing protein [Lewinellaceae bacterium]